MSWGVNGGKCPRGEMPGGGGNAPEGKDRVGKDQGGKVLESGSISDTGEPRLQPAHLVNEKISRQILKSFINGIHVERARFDMAASSLQTIEMAFNGEY